MGKKNTGSNSRSKKGNGNNGMLHPGNKGDGTQLFHAEQRHGVTSSKIHWAYYTEAIFGLQAPIFMIADKKIEMKIVKFGRKGRPEQKIGRGAKGRSAVGFVWQRSAAASRL